MPQLGSQALLALLVLLPGFLCAQIVRTCCVRPKQTEFDKVIEALVYTFVVYVVFALIAGPELPLALKTETINQVQHFGIEFQRKRLLILSIIPFVLAFLIGLDRTNDISGRIFRKMRATQRTTRSSVWSDTFHELHGVIQTELKDGRRVMGWLRFYSDEPGDASLFLERAAWVNEKNELVPVDGPGLLITSEMGIKYVMFLNAQIGEKQAKALSATAPTPR
jgi:hypothetical protein